MPLAADEHLRALRGRIGDVALDLFDGAVVDERSLGRAGFGAGRRLQFLDRVGELRREHVVDRILDEQAVRAHTGLPRVAVLRHDRAFHRLVQIRIVEHDERRVAAELERQLLHRRRDLLHQHAADLGRAGK